MATINRRGFAIAFSAFLANTAYAHDSKPLVLMVGSSNSRPARSWRCREGAAWMSSPQFNRVRFDQISVPKLQQVVDSTSWPERHRWVLEAFLEKTLGAFLEGRKEWDHANWAAWGEVPIYASPRFYLVARDDLLLVADGLEGWRDKVQPAITMLAGA
jgi:hypothetical protein